MFILPKIILKIKKNPISKSSNVMYGFWIYLGFCFLYKSNGYYYDWRNRIRLYHKFDLNGLYKGAYHLFGLTAAYWFLFHSQLKRKEKEIRNDCVKKYESIRIFQFGVCLCFLSIYFLAIFTLNEEDKMFRLKIIENTIVSQAFFIALCL